MKLEEHPKLLAAGVAVFGVLFLAGGAALGVSKSREIKTVFTGGTEIQPEELVAAANSFPYQLPDTWVKFRPSEVVETDVYLVRGLSKSARFVLLKVGGSHIVAKVPLRPVPGQIDGQVTVWSAPLSPEGEAMAEIRKKYPQAKLLPFQIDADNHPASQRGVMLAGVVILPLLGLGFIGYGVAAFAPNKAAPAAAPGRFVVPTSPTSWATISPEVPRSQPASPSPAGSGGDWAVFRASSPWPTYIGVVIVGGLLGWAAVELGLNTRLQAMLKIRPATARQIAYVVGGLTMLLGAGLFWEQYRNLRWVAVSREGIRWFRGGREHARAWGDFAGVQRIATKVLVNGQHTGTVRSAEVRFFHGDPLVLAPGLVQDYEGLLSAIEYHSHGRTGGPSVPWRLPT
jgi:hypothetical protein